MLARRTLLAAAVAAPALSACATGMSGSDNRASLPPLPHDPHSHARPDEARVLHVALDLRADFQRRVLAGTATLTIAAKADAHEIVLDVLGLTIHSVRAGSAETQFVIGASDDELGAPMTVQLNGARTIVIDYETSPSAGALQWLDAAQTASGKPFLFSQGESILTRTWVPTQDSPGIRQTYDARIVVPEDLKTVMSAQMLTPNGEAADGGRAWRYRMEHPIPCYLFALAIGDLEFRSTGPRTGVWSEPTTVDAAAREFVDMERMLEVAERLYGPYRWGRYDVLLLPPSFPYGGMENPRMTFATPTIIAGDRSLVSVIAHEMAHSWSGNLVTNAVWADSWLNEGFTTYIEGRIDEALYGTEQYKMAQILTWVGIQNAIRQGPPDVTRLHLIGERGADDSNGNIVYGKGALFLRTIEGIIGRGAFDVYLKSYFNRFAFQPMTTEKFIADFRDNVVRGNQSLEAQLQLDAWAYGTGLPSNALEPHSEAFDRVAGQVAAFNAGGAARALPWSTWGTMERQRFLQTLPRTETRARLDELEQALHLNETGNSEVLFDWLSLAVANRYEPAIPALEHFLTSQGRGKFVRPLYAALMRQGAWGQAHARRIYAEARRGYHPIVVAALDRIVTAH